MTIHALASEPAARAFHTWLRQAPRATRTPAEIAADRARILAAAGTTLDRLERRSVPAWQVSYASR